MLLAALAAEIDWSWIPDVAIAAAATAAILLAWETACRALYVTYKAACKEAARLGGCRAGRPCGEYPPRIAAWTACASGRQAYLDAGCDVIIPTKANHPQAAAIAWKAVANCTRLQFTCVPDCPPALPPGGLT